VAGFTEHPAVETVAARARAIGISEMRVVFFMVTVLLDTVSGVRSEAS
jgi:hypothetical protein